MKFKELLKPLTAAVVLTSSLASVNAQTAGSATDTGRVEEVVVTALGIKKQQRSLGYAVQSVKGKELVGSGEQNVVQALSSKVAGALVTSSSGTPGASSRILLRGAATFTGNNQPLFVVDGVPIDNSTDQSTAGDSPFNSNLQGVNNSNRAVDINPDDIENITVLKGPAARSHIWFRERPVPLHIKDLSGRQPLQRLVCCVCRLFVAHLQQGMGA